MSVVDQYVYYLCSIMIVMKAIQVTFDEALLERLDRQSAVRERGRSAVLREATVEYLRRQEAVEIAARYQAGYRDAATLEDDLGGWASEGSLAGE